MYANVNRNKFSLQWGADSEKIYLWYLAVSCVMMLLGGQAGKSSVLKKDHWHKYWKFKGTASRKVGEMCVYGVILGHNQEPLCGYGLLNKFLSGPFFLWFIDVSIFNKTSSQGNGPCSSLDSNLESCEEQYGMSRYHIKKISDLPFKSYDFKKVHLHYINRNYIICPPLFSIVAVRRTPHKPLFACLSCVAAASHIVISRWQTVQH
jgi:hypothetical protein